MPDTDRARRDCRNAGDTIRTTCDGTKTHPIREPLRRNISMSEPNLGRNTGNAGKGRPKGSQNKTTTAIKEAILAAAEAAGGGAGMIGYLTAQAKENPASFLTLLGKVLPLQVGNDDTGAFKVTTIERRIVEARS